MFLLAHERCRWIELQPKRIAEFSFHYSTAVALRHCLIPPNMKTTSPYPLPLSVCEFVPAMDMVTLTAPGFVWCVFLATRGGGRCSGRPISWSLGLLMRICWRSRGGVRTVVFDRENGKDILHSYVALFLSASSPIRGSDCCTERPEIGLKDRNSSDCPVLFIGYPFSVILLLFHKPTLVTTPFLSRRPA